MNRWTFSKVILYQGYQLGYLFLSNRDPNLDAAAHYYTLLWAPRRPISALTYLTFVLN